MYIRTFQLVALLSLLLLHAGCQQDAVEPGARQATLQVVTSPAGAQIVVGGETLGVSPQEIALDATTWHLVELRLPGYESHWVSLQPLLSSTYEALEIDLAPVTAPLYITSLPPGALVRLDDVDRGVTPLILPAVALGQHQVELQLAGFANKRLSFDVTDAHPIRIVQNMESMVGTLEVYTTPGGADISVDGKPHGVTPTQANTALVISNLLAGTYEVTASRPGYHPVTRSVLVPRNATQTLRLPAMQALPGAVNITSTPAGAKVHIKATGELLGETPLTLENLPDGDLTFTISKPGFDSVESSTTITQGLVRHIDATLINNRGSVAFITEPPGVQVFIDGRRVGVTEPADTPLVSKVYTEANLAPGPHQLNLVRPGYENFGRSFFVEKGKTENLGSIKLRKQWIPSHLLKIRSGPTYRGILVTQYPDGSIEFERARNIKVTYKAEEVEFLREIRAEDGN